jgi:hypothetical protein
MDPVTLAVLLTVVGVGATWAAWKWPRHPKGPPPGPLPPPPPMAAKSLAGRHLKVALDSVASYKSGDVKVEKSQIVLSVTNVGSAPVKVVTVGLELAVQRFVAWPVGDASPSSPPIDLKPNEALRIYFPYEETEQALRDANEYGLVLLFGFARDDFEEKTRSQSMSLRLDKK